MLGAVLGAFGFLEGRGAGFADRAEVTETGEQDRVVDTLDMLDKRGFRPCDDW